MIATNLTPTARRLAVGVVNRTPPGIAGHAEAAEVVRETWNIFADEGVSPGEIDGIIRFIRWAKLEGFGISEPLNP